MQNWVIISEDYLNYLRGFEPRIPHSNYGETKFKPFFGTLFEMDELVYVTQVSHPKSRHHNMRDALDFQKIYLPGGSSGAPDRLIAVVNLNYMFPLPKTMLKTLDYGDIDQYRTFPSSAEKGKYIDLLKKEISKINELGVEKKAFRLYQLKLNYPNDKVSCRCVDFKFLESKSREYNSNT